MSISFNTTALHPFQAGELSPCKEDPPCSRKDSTDLDAECDAVHVENIIVNHGRRDQLLRALNGLHFPGDTPLEETPETAPQVLCTPPTAQPRYVKKQGSWLNPLNWFSFLVSLFRGKPEITKGMQACEAGEAGSGGFVIDGFDDAGNAIGRGLDRVPAAVAALAVNTATLMPVYSGAQGAFDEWRQCKQDYEESWARLNTQRTELMAQAGQLAPGRADALREATSEIEYCTRLAEVFKEAHAAGRDQRDLNKYLLALVRYDTAYKEHALVELKYRAIPSAAIGANAMFGGVVLYQGGAFARLSAALSEAGSSTPTTATASQGSVLSNLAVGSGAQGAADILMLGGHLVMFVGQVAMMVHGAIAMVRGVKAQHFLNIQRALIREADPSLLPDSVKKALLAQNTQQKRLNLFGNIVGNGALSTGQLFMLLGGAVIGLGLPLLITGAGLTIAAVIGRSILETINERNFGYDPDAFDRSLINAADSLEEAADLTRCARLQFMAERAWISIGAAVTRVKATHPKATTAQQLEQLDIALSHLHQGAHQEELREVMRHIRGQHTETLRLCLENDTPGLAAFLSLQPCEKEGHLTPQEAQARIREFIGLSRAERFSTLLKLQGLDDGWQRRTVQQLVVNEASRSNRQGSRYRDYVGLEKTTEKRTGAWGLWQWLFGNKRKTSYAFDVETFQASLDKPGADRTRDHVEEVVYAAMAKTVRKESAYQARSRLFGANQFLLQLVSASSMSKSLQAT